MKGPSGAIPSKGHPRRTGQHRCILGGEPQQGEFYGIPSLNIDISINNDISIHISVNINANISTDFNIRYAQ